MAEEHHPRVHHMAEEHLPGEHLMVEEHHPRMHPMAEEHLPGVHLMVEEHLPGEHLMAEEHHPRVHHMAEEHLPGMHLMVEEHLPGEHLMAEEHQPRVHHMAEEHLPGEHLMAEEHQPRVHHMAEEHLPGVHLMVEEHVPGEHLMVEEHHPGVYHMAEEHHPGVHHMAEEHLPGVHHMAEEHLPGVHLMVEEHLPGERLMAEEHHPGVRLMAEQQASCSPTEGVEQDQETCRAASSSTAPLAPEEGECRICYNAFDSERHAPKLLECLHTFCLECLRQLHLRAARTWAGRGASSIRCPLCCHLTALPGGSAQNLPLNTKRLEVSLLGSAHQRPLPEQSCQGASAGASGADASLGAQEAGTGTDSDPCCISWRKVLGCLCACVALLLLAAAWLRWVPLPIFLAVAVGLIFCSTLPFMVFYFKFASEPRTIFLRRQRTSSD